MTFARTGDRRLRRAEALPPYDEYDYTVQEYGNSCPQQAFTLPIPIAGSKRVVETFNRLYGGLMHGAEDCKAHPMSPDICSITQTPLRSHRKCSEACRCHVRIQVTRSSCMWFYAPAFLWHLGDNFFSGSMAVDLKSVVPLRVYPPSLARCLA
jgi:hypothetical protein